jgi:anti-anti-sigma factor
VLNLSGVTFVASSGAGTLLVLTREFKKAGGNVRLVQLSDAVEMVVDILNLKQLLTIDLSEMEAFQADWAEG